MSSKRAIPVRVLPLAAAVDERYILPLAVLLASIKRRLSPDYRPVLHLIHAGLPQAAIEALSSLVETRSIVPSDSLFALMPRTEHYPHEASFPLLLAEALPGLERVLFVDADLFAMDDLATLWEAPLNHHVLAACADVAIPLCASPRGIKRCRELGIPPTASYFNGGLLLVDLQRWRERQITRKVLDYIASSPVRLDFIHQDAMNAILWNDWEPLDPRWNLLGSRSGRSFERPATGAWRNPGIVHFSGRMKPWRIQIGGPFYAPYREVLDEIAPLFRVDSPTPAEKLYGIYDRYFRTALFPLEQYLWRQHIL